MSHDIFLDSVALTFQDRISLFMELGLPIIPLAEKSKEPVTEHAALDASRDARQIAAWIKQFPKANVGAVATYDGFWFLDDDAGTLNTLVDIPNTLTVRTSRGFHYYFEHDDLSRAVRYGGRRENAVIDIPGFKGEARCNNQYVVGFGSIHPSGARYQRVKDIQPIPATAELLTWLQESYLKSEESKGRSVKGPRVKKELDPTKPSLLVKGPPPDEGFKRLAQAVEDYGPLVRRMNALEDERFHDPDLSPGANSYCPIPSHGPWRSQDVWQTCFGPMKRNHNVLSCLGCGWTGDIIAAVQVLDGLDTNYDAARVICKEEGLNFDDYFGGDHE